jgi:hypothetical protein
MMAAWVRRISMRWMIAAALALGVAACGDATTTGEGGQTEAAADTYTMEIRASELEQSYIVIAPDGRTVGARASGGASALMADDRAQALAGTAPPEGEPLPEVMALRLPGFSMSISGDEEEGQGESGRVNLSMGADGQQITVHADEGGPGEADDRAYVRITGADAQSVREFIDEAEELSPEVKAEMRAALGL